MNPEPVHDLSHISYLEESFKDISTTTDLCYEKYHNKVFYSKAVSEFFMYDPEKTLWRIVYVMRHHVRKTLREVSEPVTDYYNHMEETSEDTKTKKIWDKKTRKWYNQPCFGNIAYTDKIVRNLKTVLYDPTFITRLNRTENLIPTACNKVVDLKTGEVRDRTMQDIFSTHTKAVYQGLTHKTPTVDKFMNEIMEPPEVAKLQRMLGYAITGTNCEHKVIALVGYPSSGRTTLLHLLQHLFQNYAQFSNNILDCNQKKVYFRQIGSRIVMCDNNEKIKLTENIVKKVTGCHEITDHLVPRHPVTFTPTAQLIVTYNQNYDIEIDDSVADSLVIIKLKSIFISQEEFVNDVCKIKDENVISKICREEFLTWIVRGSVDYHKNGLQL